MSHYLVLAAKVDRERKKADNPFVITTTPAVVSTLSRGLNPRLNLFR
jgi:hypothetical protein